MDKSDLTTSVDVDKNELLQALSRLLVFQIQGKSAVTIDITDTQIKLTSDNVEFGNGRETLNAKIDGDQLKIKFNNAFLLEALKVIPDDVVHLSASTPVKPMFITPVDSDDYTYMILPLRLN